MDTISESNSGTLVGRSRLHVQCFHGFSHAAADDDASGWLGDFRKPTGIHAAAITFAVEANAAKTVEMDPT